MKFFRNRNSLLEGNDSMTKVSTFLWNSCSYLGLLIPNIVTTWWLVASNYSQTLSWLYLLTTLGLGLQTLSFMHEHNFLNHVGFKAVLGVSIFSLVLILILNCTKKYFVSIWIYMICLVVLFANVALAAAHIFHD